MTDYARERFEELEAYVASLSVEEREEQAAKGQQYPKAVFQMINTGDVVGLYCSIKKDPSLLEKQDDYGMTPLHWGSADRPGVIQEIVTSEPSKSPWMRDRFGRLPLDVMREAEHHKAADKMERLTYPQLFHDEKGGPVSSEKIIAFEEKAKELGKVDTRPPHARDMEPKPMIPRLQTKERDAGERER